MRLVDLDPRWLIKDGRRVGFIFRCPLEPANAKRLQSCFFERTPTKEQWALIDAAIGDDETVIYQACDPNCAWSCSPAADVATFEDISVTPSLDGSKGGNWHGFVTNGAIVGGI